MALPSVTHYYRRMGPGRRALVSFLIAVGVVSFIESARESSATATELRVHTLEGHQERSRGQFEGVAPANDEDPAQMSIRRNDWLAPTPRGEGLYNIKYVALIAERHSGSQWIASCLEDFFKGKKVMVTDTFCTWKHWFQDRIHQDIQDGTRSCTKSQSCPACLDIKHTLVIALWRNPYDWLSGMHRLPHHSKAHMGMANMTEFLQLRWMLEPTDELMVRKEALIKARDKKPCMDNFLPWEVVPCRENDRFAIYELDANGEAYPNIYELRKAKIRDFNAVREWAPYYEMIRYEDMVVGTGLRDWLLSLESKYGLSGRTPRIPSASVERKRERTRSSMFYFKSEYCAPKCAFGGVRGQLARHTLHRMWDEELEATIGYHKIFSSVETTA